VLHPSPKEQPKRLVLDFRNMATRRLYYDDSFQREFTARVLSCEAVQAHSGTAPAWSVRLDGSAFYPTSGGQPFDTGKIGEASVLDVREDEGEIIHIVDRWIPTGAALGCVNWPRRFDHMQQHTGQHLLSAIFQERFGLPTVSFHLGAEICTIDLRGPEPPRDVLEGAERAASQVIFEDRPVNVRYGTAEELADIGVRKTVEREGLLRAIEIEGADLQPCGGTHVKRTGQIGLVLVRRCTKMRQDWRVEFACGSRAQRAARQDFEGLQSASGKLGCAPAEVPAAAERVSAERDAYFKASRAAIQLLAEADARSAIDATPGSENGLRVVSRVFRGVQPEYLQFFATEIAKQEKGIALLARTECGHVFFAQNPAAGKSMTDLLKHVLGKIGGKGGGPRDFARGRLDDPGKAQEALDEAKKWLLNP